MEQRVYHGTIDPIGLANALVEQWDAEETIAQALQDETHVIVQIGQREGGWFSDEPRNAITLGIEPIADGVQVTMGQQEWYKDTQIQFIGGGLIGLFPFFFAWPLGRLFGGDDEIDHALPTQIWRSVEQYTATTGAATGQTRRLETRSCPRCGVANPQVAERCSACGTALVVAPPDFPDASCPECGNNNPPNANFCLQCGRQLRQTASETANTA